MLPDLDDGERRRVQDCTESKEVLCNIRTVGDWKQKSRPLWLKVTPIIFIKMIEVRCCSFGSVRNSSQID